jgi:ankyrin repeat protein
MRTLWEMLQTAFSSTLFRKDGVQPARSASCPPVPAQMERLADVLLNFSCTHLIVGWPVQLCVKYHADINAQDEDNGGTPLMYAIHNAHDAIVESLLQLGADMEHEEQQGYTPLMVACLSDNATACEMLLKNKAALDNTDSKGRTALSMACRCLPPVY